MNEPKIIYIAHPISGDVAGNLKKVAKITRAIAIKEDNVVPVAPYFLYCNCLNDNNPLEREIGLGMSLSYLTVGNVKELRLYGNTISRGMMLEIEIAQYNGIPVIPCTKETETEFLKL